ncbi:hypothetical protein KCU95_g1879, partial [Aureobasidium melanogenum]
MSQPAEEPPRKRQRVTQACHRCRRKKYKCDSERPTCSTCRSSHSECTYGTVAKRRGLQSGYVRAVEVLWGLVFKRVEGSQVAINDLLANLSNIISPSPNDPISNGISSDRADDLLECWRNSGVPSAIELMLDGTFAADRVGAPEDMDSQIDLTLTSLRTWSLPQPDPLQGTPPQALSTPSIAHAPPPRVAGAISDTTYPPGDIFASKHTALSPLPTDWHSLTQIYFTVEHSWFPILERHTVFRIAYHYQDESDSQAALDDRQRGEYAVLWAVLALGEIHASGVSSPRAIHFKAQSRHLLDKDPVEDDYATYAQAFLLWSMIQVGCNKLVLARSMLAQALVFCTATVRGSSERICAPALSGCFVMDALLALATDTRPLMSVDDLHTSVPCDESGSDEWEPYVERFGTQGSPVSSSLGTPAVPNTEHVIEKYKVLWGWDYEPRDQEDHLAEATLVDRVQGDDQLGPSLTSQDPLHAAMHCEIPHGLSTTFNLDNGSSQTDEQASVMNMVASRESNAAGMDPNLMIFDDITASGTDSMLADTPTQLLDYLALLQQNESVGNSQDFMQSLGFFMDFEGANT